MDNQNNNLTIHSSYERNVRESLEPLRKSYNIQKSVSVGSLGVGFISLFLLSVFFPSAVFLGFIALILFFYMTVQSGKTKKEYDTIYKQFVVNQVIKSILDEYQYDPFGRFDPHYLDAMRIFNRDVYSCTYKGEDMIQGTYKGVHFQQSDTTISYTVGSGKNRKTVWVMRGRIAEFEYGKEIHSSVLIVPKAYDHANKRGLQRIETENVSFNKKYNVFSGDAHTAFYVLTPQLMEYINRLNQNAMTYIRFLNGRVFVIQPEVGGAFEPNMSRNFDFEAECQHVRNDIGALLGIIDIMELDDSMEQYRNLLDE